MVYFISSWYQENEWKEQEEFWFRPKKGAQFDDTVKQVQLFSRNNLFQYEILLLSHAPNFRHFLHRQSIFRAHYWSVFDAMQCIERKKVAVFSFHDLVWPSDVEFIYSSFAILVHRHGKKYACIHFGDDGNMIQIELYKNNQLIRVNHYDDRGFVSLTVVYADGKPYYEQYLDEKGTWKFTRFFEDDHVEVNPASAFFISGTQMQPYRKLHYEDMEEIIEEVLNNYIVNTDEKDIFCVAMHERHTDMLAEVLKGRKKILSFYGNRMNLTRNVGLKAFMDGADYIVADTRNQVRQIEKKMDQQYKRITAITPFDSRIDNGISLEFPYQNITVFVDNLEEDTYEELLKELVRYALTKEKARVHLLSKKIGWDLKKQLAKQAGKAFADVIAQSYVDADRSNLTVSAEEEEGVIKLKASDEERDIELEFDADQCTDAMQLNQKMKESRIFIDLSPVPDQFLQITALSMGIPQITGVETQYIQSGQNGKVIQYVNELTEWLDFYLDDLTNWNKARVASYQMGEEFSTDKIRKQWIAVIDRVEEGDWRDRMMNRWKDS